MICPLMSYAANQVQCVKEECAVWDKREEACGMLSVGHRVQEGLFDLVSTLNEIKVKF